MQPILAIGAGLALGTLSTIAAIAFARPRAAIEGRAQDHYVLAWWAIAVTGYLAAARAELVARQLDDLALSATIDIGLVLAWILAMGSLFAAGGYLISANAAVKARASARHA